MQRMMSTVVVGISGGSGSGKTTFARMLAEHCFNTKGAGFAEILSQDSYYIDQSAKFRGDGDPSVNFDHPDAIDFALIRDHIIQLKNGDAVNVPIYDFATHSRAKNTNHFSACHYVILDGMLILSQPSIVELLDYTIFVDAPESVRYERRLRRDVRERGRTPEGVEKQFQAQVKPMHDAFIEPSKAHAHRIVSGLAPFQEILAEILSHTTGSVGLVAKTAQFFKQNSSPQEGRKA